MLRPLDERRFRFIFFSVFLGLVIALGTAGSDVYFKTRLLEVGDPAINALQIDNAKHFRELYGNYSRYEFNHPGPAFFYVYAAGEWLFYDLLNICQSPATAHLLTCMIVQSAFFALMLGLISQFVAWRAVIPAGLLAASLHFGYLKQPFMSVWPPHVLTMPFLAFVASCISFSMGRTRHAILMVLTGGFLFHGHVAQPLFVGGLGLLAVGFTAQRIRKDATLTWRDYLRQHRKIGIACAAIIGVFLLPLAIDVVRLGTKSNVATIIGRFMANQDDSKSFLQSFLYFVSFATYDQNQEQIFSTMSPQVWAFLDAYSVQIAAWAFVLIAPPLIAILVRKRLTSEERRFFFTAYVFLAATMLFCSLWGMAQAGPMFNFNGYFYYGVYYFGLLLALSLALCRAEHPRAAPLAAVACAAAAVAFTTLFHLEKWSDDSSGMPIAKALKSVLASDKATTKPKLIVFEHRDWPNVAPVALYLQRHDKSFFTDHWWEFMFGQRHDIQRLGDAPEEKAAVWWLTKPGDGGIPITSEISLFTQPAPLKADKDEIKFTVDGNGFRYAVNGLQVGYSDYTWTVAQRVVFLFAPQHADRDVQLVFDVESAKRIKTDVLEEPADIYLNGLLLGRLSAKERGEVSVTVPAAQWNEKPEAKLELRFPDAVRRHKSSRPRFDQWYGWALWKIRTQAAP